MASTMYDSNFFHVWLNVTIEFLIFQMLHFFGKDTGVGRQRRNASANNRKEKRKVQAQRALPKDTKPGNGTCHARRKTQSGPSNADKETCQHRPHMTGNGTHHRQRDNHGQRTWSFPSITRDRAPPATLLLAVWVIVPRSANCSWIHCSRSHAWSILLSPWAATSKHHTKSAARPVRKGSKSLEELHHVGAKPSCQVCPQSSTKRGAPGSHGISQCANVGSMGADSAPLRRTALF